MGPRVRGRHRRAVLSIVVSLVLLAAVTPSSASAATVTNAWRAKIGSAGVNGLATVSVYTTGTGSIVLKLAKLRPATYLPVTLHKGTCASVGTALVRFPTIRTTSTGAAARTTTLTATQVTLIRAATKGTGKIAIRVGSATTGGIKCGLFAILAVPPYVAATVTVGIYPLDVAVTGAATWVANGASYTLSKIDPATNAVLSAVTLGPVGSRVALSIVASEGALWVSDAGFDPATKALTAGNVMRIDASTGQTVATVPVGRNGIAMAASPGAIWVANYDDGTVTRIDTTTNQVVATVTLAVGVGGLAYGEGALWASNENTGSVSRIDPATNAVTATVATVGGAENVTTGAGSIWVTNWGTTGAADGVLSRIDPVTNQVARTIPVGTNPVSVAFGGGFVWVAFHGEPSVVQVDPATNAVRSRIAVGATTVGIDCTDHAVWAVHPTAAGADPAAPGPGSVTRITY
jgi:YVTN family beta-propeller protein